MVMLEGERVEAQKSKDPKFEFVGKKVKFGNKVLRGPG
jgi:hypothetical protein